MRLTWIGHSSFLAEGEGTRILMDPYATPGCGAYRPVDVEADVVTISHSYDAIWHGDLTHVHGDPIVLKDLYGASAEAHGIRFDSLRTHHTAAREKPNTALWFDLDGMRFCHLGDLGHPLSEEALDRIRPVDVVLAPTSGVYIIEPEALVGVLEKLAPKLVVPMHFKNDRIDLGMRPVDDFLHLAPWPVDRAGVPIVQLEKEHLPDETRVLLLTPAR